MALVDFVYGKLIRDILERGERVQTRNSTCLRIFGHMEEFASFPLVSARKTAWKNALREWEWFMSGSSNIKDLHESVRPWWQPFADAHGELPFNYSEQFRAFCGDNDRLVDQIELLIDGIKHHPFSRRNVITTWNTADMTDPRCRITNCHGTVIQCFVGTSNRLHLTTYQRSADVVCGLPHNWAQYWAFLMWLAHRGGREVGSLMWMGGDVHVYESHLELAKDIARVGQQAICCPRLVYEPTSEDFRADDFSLSGEYQPILTDRAEMIV